MTRRQTSSKTVNGEKKNLINIVDALASMGGCTRVFWTWEAEEDAELPEPIVVKSLTGQYRQVKRLRGYLAKVKGGGRPAAVLTMAFGAANASRHDDGGSRRRFAKLRTGGRAVSTSIPERRNRRRTGLVQKENARTDFVAMHSAGSADNIWRNWRSSEAALGSTRSSPGLTAHWKATPAD